MSTKSKQEKFRAWLHALNATLLCVSQLKIKICYKYTRSVCWQLCFEHSLGPDRFISHSYPIFCFRSLLTQLLTFCHSMLFPWKTGRWDDTVGFASEWAVVWTNCRKSLEQQKMLLVPSSPRPISLFPFCFFRRACFRLLTHWCREGGFEKP